MLLSVLVCSGRQIKGPQTRWLEQQSLPLSFGGWKSEIKVLAKLASPESSLWLEDAPLSCALPLFPSSWSMSESFFFFLKRKKKLTLKLKLKV